MMRKKSTRSDHSRLRCPASFRPGSPEPRFTHWLVPFQMGDYACIYHGHTDEDDHSRCGPQLFCCQRAAARCQQHYPVLFPPDVRFSLTEPAHLLTWLTPSGPQVFYFYFCDPLNPQRLYFRGFAAPLLRSVLRFESPLIDHVVTAVVLA
ncbi:MAG: hypothetical protein H6658_09710 [Ardenticatenaceae bacterium]|nr:hypothetical protein [Ardenticatenaceae bacterium]